MRYSIQSVREIGVQDTNDAYAKSRKSFQILCDTVLKMLAEKFFSGDFLTRRREGRCGTRGNECDFLLLMKNLIRFYQARCAGEIFAGYFYHVHAGNKRFGGNF
jgi:hypothetical protein